MDILQKLVRANALLLQGAYQGAEHLLDSAIVDVREFTATADNAEQLQIRVGEMAAEIERLSADSEQLQPSPAVAAPDGWKLVPIEPTEEMIEAAHEKCGYIAEGFGSDHADHYRAMLAVSPESNQSPRITEQDAREIAGSVIRYCNTRQNVAWDTESFMRETGAALLNKLNVKGDSNGQ